MLGQLIFIQPAIKRIPALRIKYHFSASSIYLADSHSWLAYHLNEKPMVRLAREAGAVYKIGKMVRVRRTIFEAYLRRIMLIEVAETDEEDEGFDGRGK